MGDWSPECYRCEWLDGATTAVEGARFRGHNRLGKVRWHTDAIVTVADPGREFAFTTLHKEGREETLWRYELRQVGAGTEVIESYRFLWCPIANRIAELPIPRDKQLRRGIQETLHRIKTAAEQGSRSSSDPWPNTGFGVFPQGHHCTGSSVRPPVSTSSRIVNSCSPTASRRSGMREMS